MTTINKISCAFGRLSLFLLALTLLSGVANAKGGTRSGGSSGNRLTAPGQCTSGPGGTADPTTTAEAVLVKQQNNWVFGITVVGPNSVGDWSINYSKNNVYNVYVDPIGFPPPGGWTTFIASTNPGEKGIVSFTAEATSGTGEVCTVMIAVKI